MGGTARSISRTTNPRVLRATQPQSGRVLERLTFPASHWPKTAGRLGRKAIAAHPQSPRNRGERREDLPGPPTLRGAHRSPAPPDLLPHPAEQTRLQPPATRPPRRAESRCCARLRPHLSRVATPSELRLCRPDPTLCPQDPNPNDSSAAPGAWLPETGPTRLGAASKPEREVCMGALGGPGPGAQELWPGAQGLSAR